MKNILITSSGILLGAFAGYLYYAYWLCTHGCMITSKPLHSSIYGAIMVDFFSQVFILLHIKRILNGYQNINRRKKRYYCRC